MFAPPCKPAHLDLFKLQTIVRKVQEVLWWDPVNAEWINPADTVPMYAKLRMIAEILTEYDLAPIDSAFESSPTTRGTAR